MKKNVVITIVRIIFQVASEIKYERCEVGPNLNAKRKKDIRSNHTSLIKDLSIRKIQTLRSNLVNN